MLEEDNLMKFVLFLFKNEIVPNLKFYSIEFCRRSYYGR